MRKWVSLPFPWSHLPCSRLHLILSVVILTERRTQRSRAEKLWDILPLIYLFIYLLLSFLFKNCVKAPFPSVILDIPSRDEWRFNCEICIVTQQTHSPSSHRPFTAEGHFSYKSLPSRSQPHQHFVSLRTVIRRNIPAAAELVAPWRAGWRQSLHGEWLTSAFSSPAAPPGKPVWQELGYHHSRETPHTSFLKKIY